MGLTADRIDRMDTSLEMDGLVAVRVMGLVERRLEPDCPCPECGEPMRMGLGRAHCKYHGWTHSPYLAYSLLEADAWLVVEKLRIEGYAPKLLGLTDLWEVTLHPNGLSRTADADKILAEADEMPLAVCRAALKARLTPEERKDERR